MKEKDTHEISIKKIAIIMIIFFTAMLIGRFAFGEKESEKDNIDMQQLNEMKEYHSDSDKVINFY